MRFICVALLGCLLAVAAVAPLSEAKLLEKCEIVRGLAAYRFQRSFLSNWLCLIMAGSGGDTKKVTHSGVTSRYGLFQLESGISCEKNFDGGSCRTRCDALLTDDLDRKNADCAQKFMYDHGFKGWDIWVANCKNKELPSIRECFDK